MANADFTGTVTSVASPSEADGELRYAFTLASAAIVNPAENVFNISPRNPFANPVMQVVLTAFGLGVHLQVMLVPGEKRLVDWVQIPRPPKPSKRVRRSRG